MFSRFSLHDSIKQSLQDLLPSLSIERYLQIKELLKVDALTNIVGYCTYRISIGM